MTRKRRWLIILTVLGVLVVAGGVTMGWIQHQRQAHLTTPKSFEHHHQSLQNLEVERSNSIYHID